MHYTARFIFNMCLSIASSIYCLKMIIESTSKSDMEKSLVYNMDLITCITMVRVATLDRGCVIYSIRNGLANYLF